MMEQFTTALYNDLHGLRKEMAQTTRDLKVGLKEAVEQVHEWRAAANEGFETVNENIQVRNHSDTRHALSLTVSECQSCRRKHKVRYK